ncbi:AsmA family protein [Siccirubricoccus deserti]
MPLLALGLFVALFRWDWLIPLAEARASAALGRPVSIEHLHLDLGRTTTVTLEGLRIGNPPEFEAEPPFAEVPRVSLDLDAMALLRDRSLVIPTVRLDQPAVEMRSREDEKTNYAFNLGGDAASRPAVQGPQIGALLLRDGKVHTMLAGLRADFTVSSRPRSRRASRHGCWPTPRAATPTSRSPHNCGVAPSSTCATRTSPGRSS